MVMVGVVIDMDKKKEKKEQCDKAFTFSLGFGPGGPGITFRCMRDEHSDGKHEYHGISAKGWDFKVAWDEPKGATVGMEKAFVGKESQRTM